MDDRAVERVVTDTKVLCLVQGRSLPLALYDLSTKGCMLEAPGARLIEGDCLTLDFLEGIMVKGRVAWVRGPCMGVEFPDRLQPVVVRHLGYKIPPEAACGLPSRDRFGRPLGPLSPCPTN